MAAFEIGVRQAAMEFDASDLDRDRQIDYDEFSKMVRQREMAIHTEEALRRRFDDMDGDGSGLIDVTEYIKFALRDALARSGAQLTELFQKWDVNGNGVVSIDEFRKAVGALGFEVRDEEIDAIFIELDFNMSGTLELRELKQKLFTKGPAASGDGTAGPVDPRHALRKLDWREGQDKASAALETAKQRNLDSPTAKDAVDVAKQLRSALGRSSARLLDIFRAWDDNADGLISKREFRQAIVSLGFEVPRSEVDALFDMFDRDGSGSIDYRELAKSLRRRERVSALPCPLRPCQLDEKASRLSMPADVG